MGRKVCPLVCKLGWQMARKESEPAKEIPRV